MKKILLILCLFPILVFSQKSYKIPADSTILNNIGSGKNELVIRNATSNITGGVLTNLGNGVTAFVVGAGSGVSQTTLNDSILAVRNIRKVDTLYKNFASDSIIFFINGIRYSVLDKDNNTSTFTFTKNATQDSIIATHDGVRSAVKDSIGVDTDAQTLTAGVNTLTISGGNTVDLNRKVDTSYSFRNASLDSICQIVIINGNPTRSCIKDSTGGGAASLSGLTAATATNNIFNTNYKQRWNWNTIAGDTALVIASNSVNAASNTQTLFSVFQSGANATSTQTTYGAIFSNKKTGTSSTNIAGRFVASGANNNYAIEAENQIKILNASTGTRYLSFWSGSTENARIGNLNGFGALASDNLDLSVNNGLAIVFRTTAGSGVGTEKMRLTGNGQLSIGSTGSGIAGAIEITGGSFGNAIYVADAKGIVLNGGSISLNGGLFKPSLYTSFGADGSDNMFLGVSGGAKMIIANTNGVSIGASTTPASSAILDVVSTTKGFLPPRMTTTQRDAISSPATGLTLFCTDCTATDASTGVMQTYNGATWKNFW